MNLLKQSSVYPISFLSLLSPAASAVVCRGGVIILLIFFSLAANASDTAAVAGQTELMANSTDPSQYFGKIMISLIFILLIIFAFAWLLKRFGSFTGLTNVNMKVIGAINVGQKERIVLLEVGKEQLVIGVTPSEITMLHQMEEPIDVAESQVVTKAPAGSFAARLQEAMTQKSFMKPTNRSKSEGKND